MRSSIAIAAAIVGAVNAAPGGYGYGGYGAESSSVPVVYSTSLVTVYSCGPEVTDCPAKYPSSTPAPYVPYTTEAPYTSEAPYSAPAPYSTPAPYSSEAPYSAPAPYSSPAPYYSAPAYNVSGVPYITKTLTSTSVYAVTTGGYSTETTEVYVYTTVCPATETEVYPVETATPYVPESSVYVAESTSTPCAESSTVTVVVPVSSAYYPTGTGVVPYPSGTGVYGTVSGTGYGPAATYPPQFTGAASHANAGLAVAGLGAFAALFL